MSEITNETQDKVTNGSENANWRVRFTYVAAVLLVVLLFGAIRFRLRNFPLERDEGEYAYAGQLMLQGVPPYQLAYNMKLPGTYAAYAIVLAVFGQTPAGVHLGLILVNAATTFLIFLLAGRLFGRMCGAVSAASFALLSASPSVLGLAGHATHFVLLPAIAALVLLLKALETKRSSLFFCSGLLLGVAFLMKQPGILFAVFAFVYVLYHERRQWRLKWPTVIAPLAALSAGVVIPFGLTCLVLAKAGVFDKFCFWTFSYAREYGTIISIGQGAAMFLAIFPSVVGSSVFIWVLASLGLATLLRDRDRAAHPHADFAKGFLLFSAAAVCPGMYFREHYFILVLPAVAVLAGVAVSSATRRLVAAHRRRIVTVLPMCLFLIIAGYTIFRQRAIFFKADPVVACREIYGANPFPEALKVAEYIRAQTSPGQRIAILGSEPEIYFYSNRRSATGYIYTYGLVEHQKYALKMQQELIADIESAHPEYIVTVQVPTSWLPQPGAPALIFQWSREYLPQHYDVVGVADILQDTQYAWGEAAKGYKQRSPYAVYVFRRKA